MSFTKKCLFVVMIQLLTISITNLTIAETIGDVNNDGKVDLNEAIHALKVVADIIDENVKELDTSKNTAMHERFVSTSEKIRAYGTEEGVANEACINEFGNEYRVASWNDITQYFTSATELQRLEFFINLRLKRVIPGVEYHGLNDAGNWRYLVSYNGKEIQSSNWHYFFERHDGTPFSNWAIYSNIDNNTIDLGAWYTTSYALCYKPE